MERSLAPIAGLGAFALMVVRSGRLLDSGSGQQNWMVILIASGVLGAVIWWLASQIPRSNIALAIFAVAGVAMFLRISVPETLLAGLVPGPNTLPAFTAEMGEALSWIRHGVPPIIPTEGVVAIISGLAYIIGGLYTWGLTGGPIGAVVLPSLVMYLQFAVFDRRPAGLGWMLASAGVIALSVVASAVLRQPGVGRARDRDGNTLPRRSTGLAFAMASIVALASVTVANAASGVMSEYGVIPRGSSLVEGLFGGGGTTFDRWVDLRQSVLNPTERVVFRARLDAESPAAASVYWRMETLDTFNGTEWTRSDSSSIPYDADRPLGNLSDRYQGSIDEIAQIVTIEALRTGAGIAPTAGVPTQLRDVERLSGSIPPAEFDILSDSALAYRPTFQSGDTYEVVAVHPNVQADIGALARLPDGALSPLFTAVAEAGLWEEAASAPVADIAAPEDMNQFLALPANTPLSIRAVALTQTAGASTDFERAWMLQHWFRDSGDFQYSTNVTTGHQSLDLAAWLTDPASPNYRTGYCEQFAASMAVLARSLGIGSRVVWGFTPGTDIDGWVVVRDSNAHAWVELWIDGFGWVPFEPTPRSGFVPPSITQGLDLEAFADVTPPSLPDEPTEPIEPPTAPGGTEDLPSSSPSTWVAAIGGLVALLLLIPAAKRLRRARRMRRISTGSVADAWDEIVDRLTDLGQDVPGSLTPIEIAGANEALVGVAARYSAEVYGGREGLGDVSDLTTAEEWLVGEFGFGQRLLGLMNPRSFVDRG